MKKVLGLLAASVLVATPVLADDLQQYNTDFNPSPEVAPGYYGKMSNPVTSKFKLSIGGYVKLDYANNSANLGTTGLISPSSGSIPAKGSLTGSQNQSIMGVEQSRIWFKADGPTMMGAKTMALVEGDFYGGGSAGAESPVFRVRHAYGAMDWANTQILFGQYWDLFAPMIASTQDFRCGNPYGAPNSPRVPQIKLTQKVSLNADNQLKFVIGVQDPEQTGNNTNAAPGGYSSGVNYAAQMYYINKSLGTAPGYFGQAMNPLTVGVFGLYGNEKLSGHTLDTYGYGLYTFVPVLKSRNGIDRTMTMSFEGQTYVAANMAFNGATSTSALGAAQGTIFPGAGAGEQNPAKAYGVAAQLIFYPTQNLGLTGGWGTRRAYDNSDYAQFATAYQRYSQQAYFNAAYDLNAAVRVAGEYQNMKTAYGNAMIKSGALANGTERLTGVDNTYRLCLYYFF